MTLEERVESLEKRLDRARKVNRLLVVLGIGVVVFVVMLSGCDVNSEKAAIVITNTADSNFHSTYDSSSITNEELLKTILFPDDYTEQDKLDYIAQHRSQYIDKYIKNILNENAINITYLVTDSKGTPLPSKRVDFEIIKGSGNLSKTADLTDKNGRISISAATSETVTIKASIYGYNASVIYMLE